jgi:hypothetical protein
MPRKQAISDEALSRALSMYAGMVGQVLNNPRRWLGVDEDPPLTAGWPVRVLDAVRDRALGEVTPASPHWATQRSPSGSSGGFGESRLAPPSPPRRPGSQAHSLTASRSKLRSAPPQPGSQFAPSLANAASASPPTGFRFSHR